MAQFAIVGLGNFGYYLAVTLYRKGHEVLGIDPNAERVQEVKDLISQAVVADATDREAMETLGLKDVDAAVVCIGSDMSVSILASLTMQDMGVKRILAMAVSDAHGRILNKLGVGKVLFPEKDLALSLAEKLHNPNLLEYLPIVEGYGILESAPPDDFVGQNLRELDLTNRFGVQVVAVRETQPEEVTLIPTAKYVVKKTDRIFFLGPTSFLDKLRGSEEGGAETKKKPKAKAE